MCWVESGQTSSILGTISYFMVAYHIIGITYKECNLPHILLATNKKYKNKIVYFSVSKQQVTMFFSIIILSPFCKALVSDSAYCSNCLLLYEINLQ